MKQKNKLLTEDFEKFLNECQVLLGGEPIATTIYFDKGKVTLSGVWSSSSLEDSQPIPPTAIKPKKDNRSSLG